MSAGAVITRAVRSPKGGALLQVDVLPYRACDLCEHGVTVNERRYCRCRAVVAPAQATPVHVVRAPNGPCGPEARHLAFPGL